MKVFHRSRRDETPDEAPVESTWDIKVLKHDDRRWLDEDDLYRYMAGVQAEWAEDGLEAKASALAGIIGAMLLREPGW